MKRSLRAILVMCLCALFVAATAAGCASPVSSPAPSGDTPPVSADVPADAPDAPADAPEPAAPPATAEPVSLKIWAAVEEQESTMLMLESFRTAHPEYDLTFDFQILGVDLTVQALETDADTAADVLMVPSGSIAQLREAGLLLPITVDLGAEHGQGSITACLGSDGLQYGVPVTPNSWFMYYDKSKYSEDEVKSLETMMAKDLGDGIANFSSAISNSWYISAWFYAAGGTLFGADGLDPTQCDWNDAKGLMAGEYLIDLMNNPKYVEDVDGIAGTLAAEGKLAAYCSGTWGAEAAKEQFGENYAAAKLPTVNIGGTDQQLRNFADFKCYTVKSSTAHPKAAQELAAWLCNEESQLMRFEANDYPPTVVSLLDHPVVAANQAAVALSEQTQFSIPQPSISKMNDYWTPAEALGKGIQTGEVTKANLQEKLDAMVEAILATF